MKLISETRISILALSLLASLFLGCGRSDVDAPKAVSNVSSSGALSRVVNIDVGSRAAWNEWEDKGGLNGNQGNVLHGIELEAITAKYYKGEYGTGPAFIEMKTYATPEQMRNTLSKVCNVEASLFVRLDKRVANGEVRFTRNGKDYICYYEASNSGRESTMLLMSEISK